jgi:hypothetical protein
MCQFLANPIIVTLTGVQIWTRLLQGNSANDKECVYELYLQLLQLRYHLHRNLFM